MRTGLGKGDTQCQPQSAQISDGVADTSAPQSQFQREKRVGDQAFQSPE